jgi:hypothetical protein
VIPFDWAVRTVGANDAMLGRDLVPEVSFGRIGWSDAVHVNGGPVGMKRIELVDESTHPECRRPIGRKIPAPASPAALASRMALASRLTNSG